MIVKASWRYCLALALFTAPPILGVGQTVRAGFVLDVTGCAELDMHCSGTDANALWRDLLDRYPGLDRFRGSVRLARNSEYVGPDATFANTDEVALIPPVSGG